MIQKDTVLHILDAVERIHGGKGMDERTARAAVEEVRVGVNALQVYPIPESLKPLPEVPGEDPVTSSAMAPATGEVATPGDGEIAAAIAAADTARIHAGDDNPPDGSPEANGN